MTAREFFLYQSQLSPGGSKYTKLAGFQFALATTFHVRVPFYRRCQLPVRIDSVWIFCWYASFR